MQASRAFTKLTFFAYFSPSIKKLSSSSCLLEYVCGQAGALVRSQSVSEDFIA